MQRGLAFFVAMCVALAFVLAGAAYFWLPSVIVSDRAFQEGVSATEIARVAERERARNDVRTSAIALITVLGVIVGAVLTWRTVRLTREGQLIDRYARGVSALASTESAAQRGAIQALEGVARSSRSDHWPIMELLTQYLREEAGEWDNSGTIPPTAARRVSPELDAVAQAIARRRRSWDGEHRLELARLDLRNVRLTGADLRKANLTGSNLSGAFLESAQMQEAKLDDARLIGTHLERACLEDAELTDAILDTAWFDKTKFRGARLTRTSFSTPVRGAWGLPDKLTRA